ncbi:cytochrome c [Magnetospirillum sp. UT-4]|uniref:c-type cytochrome n=1 Tax=Magnetospirillum sp. UT-4 TaxID=2681467 RepID=UPI0013830921|nr:cytochrome c [Magnetospirillum sp. UT-4]CAA7616007.1 conserved exported hypothetical protein [Magnetospirillum sp. UT-4]
MSGRRMMTLAVLVVLAAGAFGGWGWWRGRDRIDPADPKQVARGEAVYRGHCAECHGARLEGEPDWQTRRPTGELPAPPHDASGHTWHHSDQHLFSITKHGLARFAPPDYKTNMPSFVGRLSDRDIRAVIAFIKSTWPEDIRRRQQALNNR